MDSGIPLAWTIAMSVAFGLLLGYATGMAMGIATGKRQLLKRIKRLVSYERIDLDIDRLLRSRRGRTVDGFGA